MTNRKSHTTFQMKCESSTLDDREGHWQPAWSAILATAGLLVIHDAAHSNLCTLCNSSTCISDETCTSAVTLIQAGYTLLLIITREIAAATVAATELWLQSHITWTNRSIRSSTIDTHCICVIGSDIQTVFTHSIHRTTVTSKALLCHYGPQCSFDQRLQPFSTYVLHFKFGVYYKVPRISFVKKCHL